MPELEQLRTSFLFWLAASVVTSGVSLGLWRGLPSLRQLFDPRPKAPVGWSVLVVYFGILAFFLIPTLIDLAFAAATGTASTPDGAKRFPLWQLGITLVSGPLLFAVVAATAWLDTRTSPRFLLGLGGNRGIADAILGLFVGLVVTPFVNLFNAALSWWMASAFDLFPEEHPLLKLARQGLNPLEWTVLIAAATLAAPLMEEVLFRGVLQRWLAERSWGGDLAMVAALAVSVLYRYGRIQNAWSGGEGPSLAVELATAVFVTVMALPYLLIRTRPELAALYGTSLLFGAIHAGVWPTPVPLFLFGLVLGELTRRTGSVIPPLAAHAFFNAAACAVLAGTR